MAPVDLRNADVVSHFLFYAVQFATRESVFFELRKPFKSIGPSVDATSRRLLVLETEYKICEVYVWLGLRSYSSSWSEIYVSLKSSFRYPEEFVDLEKAQERLAEVRYPLNSLLVSALN